MIRTLHLMAKSLSFNLKTLVYFEVAYRLLGVILVYPFLSRLFYWSIDLSPFVYITNKDLFNYLLSPMTMVLLLIMILVVSLYFLIEILFLQLLFEFGIKEIHLSLKHLILNGINHLGMLSKLKPFYLWIPTLCFIYLTGFISIYGFVSTIEVPILFNQLRADDLINRLV